ncbi:MAG: type II secretion system F family protein [Phycisphaeraceae bacterium]|nr:type II secretion system F family protein [Phycisphaeraceae bacterium]
MPVFTYQAWEADASTAQGTILADTPRAARDLLRARGLTVVDVQAMAQAGAARGWRTLLGSLRLRKQPGHRVTTFVRELATLLTVGMPLIEALDTILKQHQGSFRGILLQLRDSIAEGHSLADAMRQRPDVFDAYCVSLAEVGQNAGALDVSLKRLAIFRGRWALFRGKLATALIYPAIVLTMAAGVSVFLMTVVVPRLLEGLVEAGQPIPGVTRLVKHASDFLLGWWWLLLIIVAGLAVGFTTVLRNPNGRGRRAWDWLLLRTPILGEVVRKQAIARIAMIISELMRSGIVFLEAARTAATSTSNQLIREALEQAGQAVAAGRDIGEALSDQRAFGPVVVQVFAVGQQSGRLEEMLDELAQEYDQQVAVAATRLNAVLEPLLILVMVVVVGFIAFATVLPMLEAGNVL